VDLGAVGSSAFPPLGLLLFGFESRGLGTLSFCMRYQQAFGGKHGVLADNRLAFDELSPSFLLSLCDRLLDDGGSRGTGTVFEAVAGQQACVLNEPVHDLRLVEGEQPTVLKGPGDDCRSECLALGFVGRWDQEIGERTALNRTVEDGFAVLSGQTQLEVGKREVIQRLEPM
jgi:hypothetical protein